MKERPVAAGFLAGSIAAIAASFVSLPLRSPNDALLNSGAVMIVSLSVGIAAGVVWRALEGNSRRQSVFGFVWVAAFATTVVVTIVGETQLERSVSFIVPLAAIVFSLTGLLTIVLSSRPTASQWWIATIATVIAIGVGSGWAGQGDAESGRLELPGRSRTELNG